jgi:hypothetical protein
MKPSSRPRPISVAAAPSLALLKSDLALFMSDVVDALDLAPIFAAYETADGRGQPPDHSAPMVVKEIWASAHFRG